MFRIDKSNNKIEALKRHTFTELGYKERSHIQEWIAKEPSCLGGEELLLIQKEFAGFDGTQERLDLLAIDTKGRLVIIENKLDDTGRDVTWQAMKYASYCSNLTHKQIAKIYQDYLNKSGKEEDAEQNLNDFLGEDFYEFPVNHGMTQRIILVAANFRPEVTSTVLWLLNHQVQIQCFKATPFSLGEEQFLNLEQLIPTKDTEELMIGIADKARVEANISAKEQTRNSLRIAFWTRILAAINEKTNLYANISASNRSYIPAGIGVRGVSLNFAVSNSFGRAELYIDRGQKHENRAIFDALLDQKEKIETVFGSGLIWEPMDHRRCCRVRCDISANVSNPDDWPKMIDFMVDTMARIEKAFRDPVTQIGTQLKSQ